MGEPLKVLLVEDSESDGELIVRQLRLSGYDVVHERVQDASELRRALAESDWDLIVSDYCMPGFDAPAALGIVQETGRDIPFIVVSGTIGEDVAVALMKSGAHDYLMKNNLARLGAAVDRELRDAAARAAVKRASRQLEEREAQLALAIDATEMGIFDSNFQTGKAFYSDLARLHLNVPEGTEPTRENFFAFLHSDDRERVVKALTAAFTPGGDNRFAEEYRVRTADPGVYRWISAWGKALFDTSGNPLRFLGVVRDISDRKRAEQELQFQLQLTACITEQSTDCIILTDKDGSTSFVNPECERVFGFTVEEFKQKTPHDLLHHHHPDGRPFPIGECILACHMATGEALRDHEDVLFHKDGTPIDVAVSCVPLELNGVRIGIVFTFRDITERKRAERALRESDARFRRLFDADIIGIMVGDGTRVLETNDHLLRMLGYTREEFVAGRMPWQSITPPEFEEVCKTAIRTLRTTGVCPAFEKEFIRKDGKRVPTLFAAVELSHATEPQDLCFVVDLTERKNLENQVRQAQKLENIGLLAGGVAHDFNNLLTVMMGYTNMLLADPDTNHAHREPLEQVSAAVDRAAALTRQLLTFSRRNPSEPKTLVLDDLVRNVEKLLRRLIGEQIEVSLWLGADKGSIHADPGLIEQVIVNLAVNARDAMPDGGKLYIETSRMAVDDDFAATSLGVTPGIYQCIEVSDNGTGMSPEVQARLFEPFFTTKEPGKGTGLGLSTVYGIVKQSEGSIKVHSTPGIGTSVRILFPAVDAEPLTACPIQSALMLLEGTETILVVEDEPGVRRYVRQVLDAHGYRALDAPNGADAIELAQGYRGHIDLLLTDIVLPGMKGDEVVRRFHTIRPGVPVLCMSGYPERFGAQVADGTAHLQKPFTPGILLNRIRLLLDNHQENAPKLPPQ